MAAYTQPKRKKPAASKKTKSHPPFAEMIRDAIASLKERTGSSQYAITKFIEEKHKDLPPTFRKLLLHNLKKCVAAGKLVKVKNSFKLPPTRSAPVKAVEPKKPKPAKAVSKPSPKAASKPKPKTAPKQKPVAKPKTKPVAASAKPKTAAKPKAKPVGRPAKVARTASKTSPGKKVAAKPTRKVAVKGVKKPKSVKSPAKKASGKRTKK